MATVVLTVVGGIVGGPVGAAIGSMAGQQIDRAIFAPAPREGPRLTELAVQTSSYGSAVPHLFGTMRVAGTVIWATDLQERRTTRGGGKGQPRVNEYSYTASFAVLLSGRPVASIGRIWAEGKLIRGAAGDWKVRTGFRLHRGGKDQPPDPLITAVEGAASAPAYRGCAYVVFEDLELAEFGNRIPSLTFEVVADAGAVPAGAVITQLGGGDAGADGIAIEGFAATGERARDSVALLADAAGGWIDEAGGLRAGAGAVRDVVDVRAGGAGGARERNAVARTPRALTVRHYDAARDYQIGTQRARRSGAGERERAVDLPMVLPSDLARGVAEAMLARTDAERTTRRLSLDWSALRIAPGETLRIAGESGLWRVRGWEWEAMAVRIDCAPIVAVPVASVAEPGRVLPAPDRPIGGTIVEIFELPPLDGGDGMTPRVVAAAAGTEPGWRGAALLASADGERWVASGSVAVPATMGMVTVPPNAAPSAWVDRAGAVEVQLAHGGMTLSDADDQALDRGANLAVIGEELIQFGRAEPLGGARWRLTRLWRGRRGTERFAGTQMMGDRFVLIEVDTLVPIVAGEGAGVRQVSAVGVGDAPDGVAATAVVDLRSVTPPCPVHLRLVRDEAGARLEWVRRSRTGWRWDDHVDAPLGEEREAYLLSATPPVTPPIETSATGIALPIEWDIPGVSITLRQNGAHGVSAPATIVV